MSTLALLLCAAAITQVSQAHSSSAVQDQPEVEILKSSCRKLPRAVPTRETKDADIDARINDEYRKNQPNFREIDRLETLKLNRELNKDMNQDSPHSPREKAYEYKVEIRNSSSKEVVGLRWTYVFADPISEKELVRHSFESKIRVGPGKEKKLTTYSDAAPPGVVNAQAQINKGPAWKETVIVEGVQYSDGTNWKRN